MAIPVYSVGYTGKPTYSAVAASEVIANPTRGVLLGVKVGATATTITIVRPGFDAVGIAIPDVVIGPLTSDEVLVKLDENYRDGNGQATVNFSQIVAVTGVVIR